MEQHLILTALLMLITLCGLITAQPGYNDDYLSEQDDGLRYEMNLQLQVKHLLDELADNLEDIEISDKRTESSCPSGYFKSKPMSTGPGCYRFEVKKRLTHDEAKYACEKEGAHLVTIETKEEQTALQNLMKYGQDSIGPFHTGGTSSERGNWEWENSGKPVGDGFENWQGDEPEASDQFRFRTPKICMVIYGGWNRAGISGKWKGQPCARNQYFICEYEN